MLPVPSPILDSKTVLKQALLQGTEPHGTPVYMQSQALDIVANTSSSIALSHARLIKAK